MTFVYLGDIFMIRSQIQEQRMYTFPGCSSLTISKTCLPCIEHTDSTWAHLVHCVRVKRFSGSFLFMSFSVSDLYETNMSDKTENFFYVHTNQSLVSDFSFKWRNHKLELVTNWHDTKNQAVWQLETKWCEKAKKHNHNYYLDEQHCNHSAKLRHVAMISQS